MSPLGPIQTAVYSKLTNDTTLMNLVEGVFDYVPEGTEYPYITIGEATEVPRNAHDGFGAESTITLHVWSDHRGYSEANTIAARIRTLLDHQPLTVTGHVVVSVRHEFSQTLTDPNPNIRHIPIRFRVTTEAA